ncbi:hypothetical protein [uncultured Methanobrevibacter sp.]|uniref:hypothetical protein n=1 Tax=uncultured Methanobrevibacter sp. TaxID=253161 RepID=UPI0025D2D006|nr:hypothetical protein [uncultured Methanobrevibacter sp.]
MVNKKEIKSLDLSSLTTIGMGIYTVLSIIAVLILVVYILIVGGANVLVANISLVPFIIFGTILYSIIFFFGRGFLYNVLTKKLSCIGFEIEDGRIVKIDTVSTALVFAIIATIAFIFVYVMSVVIVPFMASAILQMLMLTGQIGLAMLMYNLIALLFSPAVTLILIVSTFLLTFVDVLIGVSIYNILTSYLGGIKVELKSGREYTSVESVDAKSAAIIMSVIALVVGVVMSLLLLVINQKLAISALYNIVSSFIGGFIGTFIIVFVYNKISNSLGKLKLELE